MAACSVLGTPPFCMYPRFLANKVRNSKEFRKLGILYWSVIWEWKTTWIKNCSICPSCKRDSSYHCLITHIEQAPDCLQNTFLAPFPCQTPQSQRDWWIGWRDNDPWTVQQLHSVWDLHLLHESEGKYQCLTRKAKRLPEKKAQTNCSNSSNLGADVTHFVMPLSTPAMQAMDPFKLLMRLLFPTLGKPGNQTCQLFFPLQLIYISNMFYRKRAVEELI